MSPSNIVEKISTPPISRLVSMAEASTTDAWSDIDAVKASTIRISNHCRWLQCRIGFVPFRAVPFQSCWINGGALSPILVGDYRTYVREYSNIRATEFSTCSIKLGDAIGANFARKRERSHDLVFSFFSLQVSIFSRYQLNQIAFCWLLDLLITICLRLSMNLSLIF